MFDLNRILRDIAGAAPRLDSILPFSAPALIGAVSALTDGATIAINAAVGTLFTFTAATNGTREFSVPTNGVAGSRIYVILSNTSGGALSATTFAAAIRRGTLTLPATGFQRQYELAFAGSTWAIVSQSATDIPN